MVSLIIRYFLGFMCSLFTSSCLQAALPDVVTMPAIVAVQQELYQESGACLIKTAHADIAGSNIVFCAQIPRRRCNEASILFNSSRLQQLIAAVDQLGTDYLQCAVDSSSFSSHLNSLQADTHPVLTKADAIKISMTTSNISFTQVNNCSDLGLIVSPYVASDFQSLLVENNINSMLNERTLLARYASQSSCRDALPLTQIERSIITQILSGLTADFVRCDVGPVDDPALPDCPVGVSRL